MAGNVLYEAYRDAVRVLGCHHSLDAAQKEKLLMIVAAIGCDRDQSGRTIAEADVTSIAVQYFRLTDRKKRSPPLDSRGDLAAGVMDRTIR